jgi:hypothetical protein
MKSENIEKAADLLAKRREMQALRSTLIAKPSHELGLYASDGDGTMYEDFKITNEMGRGLLDIAIDANSNALAMIGVEELERRKWKRRGAK